MAHFRATVCGDKSNSGEASRLGHKRINVKAAGWNGGVDVSLYINAAGVDCALVTLEDGSGHDGVAVTLYDGPIDLEARATLARKSA